MALTPTHLNPDLIDEVNTLLLYNVTDPQEGIKVHKEAGQAKINAAKRLHDKGLVTQPDGGYLTMLGREAAEHLNMAHTILTTG
ncbi:MAG: TIGR02647 family protein [Gammaproteobacteria bacterium]|nr:TIGR02647 family protein [Gammaproteobacteria bacterium]MDP2140502.1 TIGR02647 family protein [Gammaproteobacteria bacterium]MDP2348811.1 TIGR02647 family protein [Gammaproteobacteria bacterium]